MFYDWFHERVPMKRLSVIAVFLFILSQACSLQGLMPASGNQQPAVTVLVVTATPAPSTDTPNPPTLTPVPPTLTVEPTVYPSDITFNVDCTALDPSRKEDCDIFQTRTRDVAYATLRQVTGASLGSCYPAMNYIILPTDPAQGAGGLSAGDTITLNKAYSIELKTRMDVHEILHSISTCNKALDMHVFHYMIQNAVYDSLGIHDPGYFISRDEDDLNINLQSLMKNLETTSENEKTGLCIGILYRKMGIAYFDLGKDAIPVLYWSTFSPVKIQNPPGDTMRSIWKNNADQVQALVETLRDQYKYLLNVPACGLP
jgi:hypothetical protein